jgi:hypothetical protein
MKKSPPPPDHGTTALGSRRHHIDGNPETLNQPKLGQSLVQAVVGCQGYLTFLDALVADQAE